MRKIAIVTGFVQIPDHPRKPEIYQESLDRLSGLDVCPILFFQHDLEYCWLWKYLKWSNQIDKIKVASADNPTKNTLAYHCVQHQKIGWLFSAFMSSDIDVAIWIDAGIFTVPGITENVIKEFIPKTRNERMITIPGCWGPQDKITNDLNWRFCGGLWVVPRSTVTKFDSAFRFVAMDQLEYSGVLDWEVNTLARIEKAKFGLPINWYQADHNETMFTNYPEPKALQ
jgi:hypothetical protein